MQGFHPGPTSISCGSVTWSKTTPVSSETKRNNERGEREREGKKKRKQALFHSSIQKITLIREEEHSSTLSNPKDRNRSRNGRERKKEEDG